MRQQEWIIGRIINNPINIRTENQDAGKKKHIEHYHETSTLMAIHYHICTGDLCV